MLVKCFSKQKLSFGRRTQPGTNPSYLSRNSVLNWKPSTSCTLQGLYLNQGCLVLFFFFLLQKNESDIIWVNDKYYSFSRTELGISLELEMIISVFS